MSQATTPRTNLKGSGLIVSRPVVDFDVSAVTFAPNVDKRLSSGPADRGVMIQGWPDGSGVPDSVWFESGDVLGNQVQFKLEHFDPYQWTIVFPFTPEWDGDDGVRRSILRDFSGAFHVWKTNLDVIQVVAGGVTANGPSTAAWVAGTTYLLALSCNTKQPIGGNYFRILVNNVATYFGSAAPVITSFGSRIYIGSSGGTTNPVNAIISLLSIYDRVLTDANGYGTDIGTTPGSDELTEIYNGGSFRDPTEVTGSRNLVFCLPTNQADEALQTTGEAHSYPVEGELDDGLCSFGEVIDSTYAVKFNGTSTVINCGSDASLDDLPTGGIITVGAWVRFDGMGGGNYGRIVSKADSAFTVGWELLYNGASGSVAFRASLATTNATSLSAVHVPDGKYHYLAGCYIDATKTAYCSVDGVWGTPNVGNGAYQADAAESLLIGNRPSFTTGHDGAIAQVAIWSNDHHSAGTDFIPPRTCPVAGAGFVDSWPLEDQSSPTASTSGLNDGTITSGTWEALTQLYGSASVPPALQFYAENDGIDFGSPAVLDNLFNADCTIEFWAMIPETAVYNTDILTKTNLSRVDGWAFYFLDRYVRFRLYYDTVATVDCPILYGVWNHFCMDWDVGTLTLRGFRNGVLIDTDTAGGAYKVDAAFDLLVNGRSALGTGDMNLVMGPIRISNTRRYTTASFVPPDRANWPADDGNTCLLIDMDDGAGATVTDSAATLGPNNGTITFGTNTRWLNTTDMATIEPGARIYNNGYVVGAIAANDGIVTRFTNDVDKDIAPQFTICPGEDGRGLWQIELYDVTGAASLMTFTSPPMNGTMDGGGANSIGDTTARWPQSMIGCYAYDLVSGTSGPITAVSGDGHTLTVTGINGAAGHGYYLHWLDGNHNHPWAESFVKYLAAGETPIDVRIKSLDGEGVLRLHRMEVPYSLLKNGGMHNLAGVNPETPVGWTAINLLAGETQPASTGLAEYHSGTEALQFNFPAGGSDYIRFNIAGILTDMYYSLGLWAYYRPINLLDEGGNNLMEHGKTSTYLVLSNTVSPVWQHPVAVGRGVAGTFGASVRASPIAGQSALVNDVFVIPHNPVTLTVTPQSQVNSTSGNTLLSNGRDLASQPIVAGRVSANYGDVRFSYTPNHLAADVLKFGSPTPFVALIWGDGNNYIRLYWQAGSRFGFLLRANGASTVTNWATGALVFIPGTPNQMRVVWTAASARLYVDGVLRATITAPTNFATVPNTIYWASNQAVSYHDDAAFGPY